MVGMVICALYRLSRAAHGISDPKEPRGEVAYMCGTCHMAVYSTYRTSVHGEALEAESNPDVPTCVECHGVHSVRGPRDSPRTEMTASRFVETVTPTRRSWQKYDISTDVFNTYLDDFHGRTVNLFAARATPPRATRQSVSIVTVSTTSDDRTIPCPRYIPPTYNGRASSATRMPPSDSRAPGSAITCPRGKIRRRW